MFIRSQRLFLRPAWSEDWEEVYSQINDPGIVRNLGRAPWPYSPEDARGFVALSHEPLFPNFLITMPASDGARVIGSIGIQRMGDEVEFGYWLGRRFWGQGYATEAGRAVLEVAKALGHREVVATHFADNPRSGAVLRKLGFSLVQRGVQRFSRGRNESVPGHVYRKQLTEPGTCGGDDGNDVPARMAA